MLPPYSLRLQGENHEHQNDQNFLMLKPVLTESFYFLRSTAEESRLDGDRPGEDTLLVSLFLWYFSSHVSDLTHVAPMIAQVLVEKIAKTPMRGLW